MSTRRKPPNRNAVDRATLHLSKAEDFAAWAVDQGYRRQPTRGDYEVLRLMPQSGSVLIFYRRERPSAHVTCASREQRLVGRWLAWRSRLLEQPCIQCGRGNLRGRLICQDCHNDNMEAG